MASGVNVFITNWRTGTNVSVQRRLVDIRVDWMDNAGVPHTQSQTVTFPDILADVPTDWLKDALTDLMLQAIRKKLGVDA